MSSYKLRTPVRNHHQERKQLRCKLASLAGYDNATEVRKSVHKAQKFCFIIVIQPGKEERILCGKTVRKRLL